MTEPTKRAHPEELQDRLDYIEGLIIRGFSQAQVVEWCRLADHKLGWGVSDRHLRNYYKMCLERMSATSGKIDRKMYNTRSIERLDHIYRRASARGDLVTMLKTTVEIIKLMRLDQPSADQRWAEDASAVGLTASQVFERMLELARVADEQS